MTTPSEPQYPDKIKRIIEDEINLMRAKRPKCKYGYTATACELGFPGCICSDDLWRDQEPTP